jgi:hypothetical protein
MKKYKILVIPSDKTGVGFYRSTKPHIHLQEMYPDLFHVDIDYQPNLNDEQFLKQYDLIHYHRTIGSYEDVKNLLTRLENLGITTVMDLDDYWDPGPHHPSHTLIKSKGIDKLILENIKSAKNVTTTTPLFANEIKKYNKNVFVLENSIDPREKQFQPNPESSERVRIGWLGGSCFDDTTEILTENGFKLFKDLDEYEKVATLNPKTNVIEYHKPHGYIAKPFKGELNCAKTKVIEYAVTPNHNMYASEVKNLTHKKLNYNLIPSENLHGKNFHVKRDGIWVGNEEEFFILPKLVENGEKYVDMSNIVESFENGDTELALEYEGAVGFAEKNGKREKFRVRKSVNNNYYLAHETYMDKKYGSDKSIKMDLWLKFFGFWVSEGWTSKTNDLYQVGVAQTKDNGYLDEIFNCLKEMGFNPTYTKDRKQVRVFDRQLWSYLNQFGSALEKYLPKEIKNLSSRQLSIFFDWFIKGDGNIDKNGRVRGYSSSKKLIDDLQEIGLKLGLCSTITNRGKRKAVIRGRMINNVQDAYMIGFSKHPSVSKHTNTNPLVKTENQFKREYDGIVYCVEVENHILYVRKNGKTFWCGNSHLHDLSLLNGLVSKLQGDGLIDKVQFVLCGFDTRGVVTMIDQKTGEQKQRAIRPEESVWCRYEEIFTNNYKSVSPKYKEYLMRFTKEEEFDTTNEPYRRVWTKPVSSYATNYNLFDISLVPIEENMFNKVKSQLKVVEAGFHKKAIIAQNFGPYTLDIDHAWKSGEGIGEGNGLLVDSIKNHKDWYKSIKRLVTSPEKIKELGESLYKTVNERYHIDVVTEKRKDLYLKLIDEKKHIQTETQEQVS